MINLGYSVHMKVKWLLKAKFITTSHLEKNK